MVSGGAADVDAAAIDINPLIYNGSALPPLKLRKIGVRLRLHLLI